MLAEETGDDAVAGTEVISEDRTTVMVDLTKLLDATVNVNLDED